MCYWNNTAGANIETHDVVIYSSGAGTLAIGNKAKTQIYCYMAKLFNQIERAGEKNIKKTAELNRKLDELAKKLGPEYAALVSGIQSSAASVELISCPSWEFGLIGIASQGFGFLRPTSRTIVWRKHMRANFVGNLGYG
jgi:hypothetical protein